MDLRYLLILIPVALIVVGAFVLEVGFSWASVVPIVIFVAAFAMGLSYMFRKPADRAAGRRR